MPCHGLVHAGGLLEAPLASQLLPSGPLDFTQGRLRVVPVQGSHPTHHKQLIHPGLAQLGEVGCVRYVSSGRLPRLQPLSLSLTLSLSHFLLPLVSSTALGWGTLIGGLHVPLI